MNAATTALDIVTKSVRVTRDELEVAMEAAGCDGRVIGSTISTLIRRGELAVDEEDCISLGDEEAIEKARQEREARKLGRDRPPPPRDEITPTKIRERIVAFVTECKHGVKARGVVEHMNGYTTEANVWYHLKQLVAHQQLRKAGQLYLPEHAKNAPVEPALDATAPTAPIVDVAAACAEAEELSRPPEQPSDKAPPETGDPVTAGHPEADSKQTEKKRKGVRETLLWLRDQCGEDAVRDVLAGFGAARLSELQPENFDAALSCAMETFNAHRERIQPQPLPPKPDRVRTIADVAAKHAGPPLHSPAASQTADTAPAVLNATAHSTRSPHAEPTATANVGGIEITILAHSPDQAARMLAAALAAIQP